MTICRMLLRHEMRLPLALAAERAGRSIPARMAIIAMTTRSSMRVKPRVRTAVFMGRLGQYGGAFESTTAKGNFWLCHVSREDRCLNHAVDFHLDPNAIIARLRKRVGERDFFRGR